MFLNSFCTFQWRINHSFWNISSGRVDDGLPGITEMLRWTKKTNVQHRNIQGSRLEAVWGRWSYQFKIWKYDSWTSASVWWCDVSTGEFLLRIDPFRSGNEPSTLNPVLGAIYKLHMQTKLYNWNICKKRWPWLINKPALPMKICLPTWFVNGSLLKPVDSHICFICIKCFNLNLVFNWRTETELTSQFSEDTATVTVRAESSPLFKYFSVSNEWECEVSSLHFRPCEVALY